MVEEKERQTQVDLCMGHVCRKGNDARRLTEGFFHAPGRSGSRDCLNTEPAHVTLQSDKNGPRNLVRRQTSHLEHDGESE